MCPLIEAKTESIACRTYVLARKPIWDIKTTNVHTSISSGHGHVVSIANVRLTRHRTRLTIDLSCLDVDLLAHQYEARPTLRCQRHMLVRRGCGRYFHITRHDLQHTILPLAKSKRRTRWCWCRCRSDILLDTRHCSHHIAAARYIDHRHHHRSRRSHCSRRHRLARRLLT